MQMFVSLAAAILIAFGGIGTAAATGNTNTTADTGSATLTPDHWLCC